MLANQQAVADDGVGMEHAPEHYASEGFGLSSMHQPAGAIDGEWQIEVQGVEPALVSRPLRNGPAARFRRPLGDELTATCELRRCGRELPQDRADRLPGGRGQPRGFASPRRRGGRGRGGLEVGGKRGQPFGQALRRGRRRLHRGNHHSYGSPAGGARCDLRPDPAAQRRRRPGASHGRGLDPGPHRQTMSTCSLP